jgi:hypothetical protein
MSLRVQRLGIVQRAVSSGQHLERQHSPLAHYEQSTLQTYPQDSEARTAQLLKRIDYEKPSKPSGIFDDLPPQEALNYFKLSMNHRAFLACGQATRSKVHPTSNGMSAVYQQLGAQLGTEKGIAYFWDRSVRQCSPNYQKIKAIETVYVERAIIELQEIASEFRSGSNVAKVQERCRKFFAECRKREILNHIPERVFEVAPEMARFPHVCRTQRERYALAIESAIEVCRVRPDVEYQRLVKQLEPIEVAFGNAITLFKRAAFIRGTNLLDRIRGNSAEAGFCIDEAKKHKKGKWENLQTDEKRYITELALVIFATRQMRRIAKELRNTQSRLGLDLAKRFFSAAKEVPLLADLEKRVCTQLRSGEFWSEETEATNNFARALALETVASKGMIKLSPARVIQQKLIDLSDPEDDDQEDF